MFIKVFNKNGTVVMNLYDDNEKRIKKLNKVEFDSYKSKGIEINYVSEENYRKRKVQVYFGSLTDKNGFQPFKNYPVIKITIPKDERGRKNGETIYTLLNDNLEEKDIKLSEGEFTRL